MLKRFFIYLWRQSYRENLRNILSLVESDSWAKFLDLGCDDGAWTLKVAEKIGTSQIFGLDISEEQLLKAQKIGVVTRRGDLNSSLPYPDNSFDVVHANQVIEHLFDVDKFVSEIYRIIKPGGYVIVSTENLAAWHNIFALLLGFQAFSQHISQRFHIGNPLSLHFNEEQREDWTHIKIFTYHGLRVLFKAYGFEVEKILGAGYYPFWGEISRFFSKIDPRHSHFITLKARKPQ